MLLSPPPISLVPFLLTLSTLFIPCLSLSLSASTTSTPESIANASALGVDVYGPIPDDAVRQPDGSYVAQPDTLAWSWIRAQIDLLDIEETRAMMEEKRQGYANIGIGLWAQDGCTGEARYADDIIYNDDFFTNVNMYSVGVSHRGLRSNEQLDFSRMLDGDLCGLYLYSAEPDLPKGCFNSQLVNCLRLWIP